MYNVMINKLKAPSYRDIIRFGGCLRIFETDPDIEKLDLRKGFPFYQDTGWLMNTIHDNFYNQVADALEATGNTTIRFDNLYTGANWATNKDGIIHLDSDDWALYVAGDGTTTYLAYGSGLTGVEADLCTTSVNAGGKETDTYIEFYGEKLHATAFSVAGVAISNQFTQSGEWTLAYRSVSINISANRRAHLYYRVGKSSTLPVQN